MRRFERVRLLRGVTLNANGPTSFTEELEGSGGQGWYRIMLRFRHAITIGTGTGVPTDEPELDVIKSITLRTSNNDYPINGVCGRALYDIGRAYSERAPRKDAIAAATANYDVYIPVYFVDPRLFRPEDTILDTGRYRSMTLDITMGGIADLITTPGTATVAFTLELVAWRTVGRILAQQKPEKLVSYVQGPAIDLSTTGLLKVPKADGVRAKRIYVYAGGTGTANTPFSGTPSDAIIDTIELQDTPGFPLPKTLFTLLSEIEAIDNRLETRPVGRAIIDFMREDENASLMASYDETNQARLDLNLTLLAGAPATPIVSIAVEEVRELAGIEA